MAVINQPTKRPGALSKLGSMISVAGGAMSAARGDPTGIIPAVSGAKDLGGGNVQPQPIQTDNPLARRQEALMESTDAQLEALRQGEEALNMMPPDVRQQFGQPLFETMMAFHNKYYRGGNQQ